MILINEYPANKPNGEPIISHYIAGPHLTEVRLDTKKTKITAVLSNGVVYNLKYTKARYDELIAALNDSSSGSSSTDITELITRLEKVETDIAPLLAAIDDNPGIITSIQELPTVEEKVETVSTEITKINNTTFKADAGDALIISGSIGDEDGILVSHKTLTDEQQEAIQENCLSGKTEVIPTEVIDDHNTIQQTNLTNFVTSVNVDKFGHITAGTVKEVNITDIKQNDNEELFLACGDSNISSSNN